MECSKYLLSGFIVALTGPAAAADQERSAEVYMSCLDLRFEPASSGGFGMETTLTLGTGEGNGEVFFWGGNFTHISGFVMGMPGVTLRGVIAFDVPPFTDENENGISDFFESSQPVWRTVTHGEYETSDGFDTGTVRATWQRWEDERFGSCELVLTSDTFGQLPAFNHTFELLEYRGGLTYLPGPETVTGQVDLARVGLPGQTLSGPMQFQITGETGLDELLYSSGTWAGADDVLFEFEEGILDREGPREDLYLSFFVFHDGLPETGIPDFQQWLLWIVDPNDADGDGKPDLSDPPSVTPPEPATLSLAIGEEGLTLTVTGTPGASYRIESAESLSGPGPQWSSVIELTLEQGSATVQVEPMKAAGFFRARRVVE